ncbi:hypothetical protein ACFV5K_25250, partial [Streptomyces sp. NPDC059744]
LTVSVDHDREPAGHWSARVSVDPAGAVVLIEGRGTAPPRRPAPPPPRGRARPHEPFATQARRRSVISTSAS